MTLQIDRGACRQSPSIGVSRLIFAPIHCRIAAFTMKQLPHTSPILDWGTEYKGKAFDALAAASIPGKRRGEGVLCGAA